MQLEAAFLPILMPMTAAVPVQNGTARFYTGSSTSFVALCAQLQSPVNAGTSFTVRPQAARRISSYVPVQPFEAGQIDFQRWVCNSGAAQPGGSVICLSRMYISVVVAVEGPCLCLPVVILRFESTLSAILGSPFKNRRPP